MAADAAPERVRTVNDVFNDIGDLAERMETASADNFNSSMDLNVQAGRLSDIAILAERLSTDLARIHDSLN